MESKSEYAKLIVGELDKNTAYDLKTGRDRAIAVGKLLYDTNGNLEKELQEYFDYEFNSDEDAEPILSEDDVMCNELEKLANYILSSGDSEQIIKDSYIQNKRGGRVDI